MTANDGIETPVLPGSAQQLLAHLRLGERHPGLQLDKFSAGGVQKDNQSKALEAVVQTTGDPKLLTELHAQRERLLRALGATRFEATTAGPLTLHLSRASALENAGICLHPLHGFVYLPGSGLKGMARAWAGTAEPDDARKARKGDIFGIGPGDKAGGEHAGAVVFHDAWPRRWPKLVQDVVNNHHRQYYQGSEPPGDWQDPVPVTFLAVGPGETFDFALSLRPGAAPELLEIARDWLLAALTWRGAGAKTNAGYGAFRPPADVRVPEPDRRREVREAFTLTLTSPGFFAGARQDGSDCDLRPASLRGVMRWWWRTLHAGAMDVRTLKDLEGKIWGDTSRAGMVRVTVEAVKHTKAEKFANETHPRQWVKADGKNTTSQGLWYAAYGMDGKVKDEKGQKQRRQRHFVPPGALWELTISVRDNKSGIDLARAMKEAKAALWLLCRYGAVGSRSRKGYGSFADVTMDGIADLIGQVRRRERTSGGCPTPALEDAILAEWSVSDDPVIALDRAWAAMKTFAAGRKHDPKKLALGLPRKVHGPMQTPLGHQDPKRHRPPKDLTGPKGERHAAPYFIHAGRDQDGKTVVRFIGFPAHHLPNRNDSEIMLREVKAALDQCFSIPDKPKFPFQATIDGDPVDVVDERDGKYIIDEGGGQKVEVDKDELD